MTYSKVWAIAWVCVLIVTLIIWVAGIGTYSTGLMNGLMLSLFHQLRIEARQREVQS